MKISILITDGAKQVMLKPETEHEKQALKMIAPDDVLVAQSKWGSYGNKKRHLGIYPDECMGGYYREFDSDEALMFVIKPTTNKEELNEKRK